MSCSFLFRIFNRGPLPDINQEISRRQSNSQYITTKRLHIKTIVVQVVAESFRGGSRILICGGGGGGAIDCARTYITSAEPNLLSAGV